MNTISTFIVHDTLDSEVELVAICAVAASGNHIVRVLALWVEHVTILLLHVLHQLLPVIDPV